MTTNDVTTPRPERKVLGEGQLMKGRLGKCLLLCLVLLLGLFTSCGDDEDKEASMRAALIGTWEEEATNDTILRYAKCIIEFSADGTMTGYTKFPADFRDTYEGELDRIAIDDEGYLAKARGRWSIDGDGYTYNVVDGYSHSRYGDWEWHPVGYTTSLIIRKGILYLYRYNAQNDDPYYEAYHKIDN